MAAPCCSMEPTALPQTNFSNPLTKFLLQRMLAGSIARESVHGRDTPPVRDSSCLFSLIGHLFEFARSNESSYFAAFLIISRSIVIATSSPTTTPPPSMFAFHFTPKSWRFIFVVAFAATRVLPHGSFTGGVGPSTSRTASLVTPRMVRSPVIFSLPAETCSIFFDLKVIVGYFATSKNLSLLRSSSRLGSLVSTVFASMVISTVDLLMSRSSQFTVPVTPLNCPRTVEIIRCFTANPAAVCCGSICQVVVVAAAETAKTAARVALIVVRESSWSMIFYFLMELRFVGNFFCPGLVKQIPEPGNPSMPAKSPRVFFAKFPRARQPELSGDPHLCCGTAAYADPALAHRVFLRCRALL